MDSTVRSLLWGLFLGLAAFAARAEEKTVLLDFGTVDSPLREGFVRVTAGGGEGVEWRTGGALREVARAIGRGPTTDAAGKKLPRPDVYFTELSCDYLTGNAPAELDIAVPPGRYKAWILLGHPGGIPEKIWNTRVSTNAGNGMANILGDSGMRWILLDGVAGDDGLTLRFDTANDWLLSAAAVVPEARWEEVERTVVAPLWREYALLPDDVAKQWRKLPAPIRPVHPEPAWSDRQKAAGFAVFSRPLCAPVWPEEYPAAREIGAPVRAFAAWDEYETLNFAIHPLRGFGNVSVRVGDLVSEDGRRLPGSLRVDYVRYMYLKPHHTHFGDYFEGPDTVMPWRDQRLDAGRNLRVWVTAHVPPHTPAGDYRGEAEIVLDGATERVPLTLKVLPITLQKDRGLVFSQYYAHPYRRAEAAPDDFSRDWWRRKADYEYREMREAGMTDHPQLHLHGTWREGRWVYEFDRLEQLLGLGRKYGFDRAFVCGFPMRALYRKHMDGYGYGDHLRGLRLPPEAFYADLTAMVRDILREAENRGWPEPILYPFDEPDTHADAMEFMVKSLEAMKAGGARVYVTAAPDDAKTAPLAPYLDVWCPSGFALTAGEVAEARRRRPGTEYWCYPNSVAGSNNHVAPMGARMTYGFGLWKSGYRGLIPWRFQDNFADPWNYLDGYAADSMNRSADDASVVPSVQWICFREGIDDGRYLHTLERWIATAERNGFVDAAAEARAELAELAAAVPAQARYGEDVWEPGVFDLYRWGMASRIMALRKLVMKE